MRATVEHHEVGTEDGSTHQRHQSRNLDVLLIQEPSTTTYRTHVNHSAWRLYRPTVDSDADRFCSLIYVNRKVSTSSHRQIPCNHPDVTVIEIWSANSQILLFSVYIPPVPLHVPDEASAQGALSAIQNTIQATSVPERSTTVVLSGNFNRHHPVWVVIISNHASSKTRANSSISFNRTASTVAFPKEPQPSGP